VAVRAQENRARHRSAGPTEEPASAQRAAGPDDQPSVKKEPKKEGHEGPADLLRWGFIMVITGALGLTAAKSSPFQQPSSPLPQRYNIHRLSPHKIVIAVHVFNVIVSQYVFAHHNSHVYSQLNHFQAFYEFNNLHNCQI